MKSTCVANKPKDAGPMRRGVASALLVAITSFSAVAQDEGWHRVGESMDDNDTYSIKLGSGTQEVNKKGEPITVVVGKTTDKKNNKIELYKWYVTDTDCDREYGKFIALDLDGAYKFEVPFADGSNSIASVIAETICGVRQAFEKEAAGKSV